MYRTPEDERTPALIAALADVDNRRQAATELAEYLGAKRLFVFMADEELGGQLLPAPGFSATLPGGKGWSDLLKNARSTGFHQGEVLAADGAHTEPALVYTYKGMALAFAGFDTGTGVDIPSEIPAPRLESLVTLAPLLHQMLQAEYARFAAHGELRVARESVLQSSALATALDATRVARERALDELGEQAQKLDHARAVAEEAGRAKDNFLAMLGHELRNPLAPIITALEILELKGIELSELDIIGRQATNLTRLVDDLLDVSRISRGKVTLRKTHIETAEIVARAVEMAAPLLETKRQQLSVEVAPHGLMLDADPGRFAQILSNLLTNAAKYSPPGTPIKISAEREGDQIRISVEDQGNGIPPEDLAQIFERFMQHKQTSERASGGLGLGLTIVRSLVELHGGVVRAHSDGPGHGSQFTVEVPAATDRPEPAEPPPVERRTLAAPNSRRVFVVDDNEEAATLLAEALEMLGYHTRVAFDGPQALRMVEDFQPHIALLDIGLPVMDGYELAAKFRAWAADQPLRLIAVSGYGQSIDQQRSAQAGFDAHLVKPVDLDTVQQAISGLETSENPG